MEKLTMHITGQQLESWENGQLSAEEQQRMFVHIGNCTCCAEQFSVWLEKDLAEPPAWLADEILERSRCPDARAARTVCHLSIQMRFLLYSLKVGFAVAVSLILLFSVPPESMDVPDMAPIIRLEEKGGRIKDFLTETLNSIQPDKKDQGRPAQEHDRSLYDKEKK